MSTGRKVNLTDIEIDAIIRATAHWEVSFADEDDRICGNESATLTALDRVVRKCVRD